MGSQPILVVLLEFKVDVRLGAQRLPLGETRLQGEEPSVAGLEAQRESPLLEGQLRDPVVLAAQLARHGEGNKARVRRDTERGTEKLRLELLPDGSVKQVP